MPDCGGHEAGRTREIVDEASRGVLGLLEPLVASRPVMRDADGSGYATLAELAQRDPLRFLGYHHGSA